MFHPSYILAKGGQAGDEEEGGGTNTGRSSCKDPAYQTWPKRTAWAKRLRSVVVPPPGYVIVKFDFSQGELRIMADASNCKQMIEAYVKGLDLHALTAANFMGMTLDQFLALPEDQMEMGRYLAKACNFGLIYRISAEGLRAYAAASYGVVMTESEAEKYHAKWFEPYPEVHTYHENQVAHARKHGWVRNQLGRVRHLPLIRSSDGQIRGKQERQAINAPTQGCLFDMMMLLMTQIDRKRPDIWMFGNTHDSLEMYLKEDTWQEDAKFVKYEAENLPLHEFDWYPKVPFTVDCEMGTQNLAKLDKYQLVNGSWVKPEKKK
jgi:DNA polymerase-1